MINNPRSVGKTEEEDRQSGITPETNQVASVIEEISRHLRLLFDRNDVNDLLDSSMSLEKCVSTTIETFASYPEPPEKQMTRATFTETVGLFEKE
ncbi:hypothetical protein AVEN_267794-1 [Araneus ventricosus]|uniref:Uncharacterized protein n=1 Tax=Araneus ventricosus TaxID=182803 RepID=A0A4Y2RBV2_ARAVE|nr:hypothetical protein AVEN_267794-1 [Araneus ventricosus]